MKFIAFVALALLNTTAGAQEQIGNCSTMGNQTWCHLADGSTLNFDRTGNDTTVDAYPPAGRRQQQHEVRLIRDERGRLCAFELIRSVPVKLACE